MAEVVLPYLEHPDDQTWRGRCSPIASRMDIGSRRSRRDGDAGRTGGTNNRSILENNIAFMDDCLSKDAISSASLGAFAKEAGAVI